MALARFCIDSNHGAGSRPRFDEVRDLLAPQKPFRHHPGMTAMELPLT
jgi:hypothetical protein